MRTDSRKSKKETPRDTKNKLSRLRKPPFLNLFFLSLLINSSALITILLIKKELPPELPLFYGLPEGKDQLSSNLGLLIAPGSSLAIVLINAFLSSLIKNDFLRKTLIAVGLLTSLLALITTIQIVFLVGAF